jgi:hypothetical protein
MSAIALLILTESPLSVWMACKSSMLIQDWWRCVKVSVLMEGGLVELVV